jgi:hypothetical protein
MPNLTAHVLAGVTVLAMFAPGCDPADQAGFATDEEVTLRPGSGAGGVWLNTSAIGGHAFSEIDLKGGKHDGVQLKQVLIKEAGDTWGVADKVEFVNGQMQVRRGIKVYSGQALLGSKWQLDLLAGQVVTPTEIRISGVTSPKAGEFRYSFEYTDADDVVVPLCPADAEGKTTAVPIKDITVDIDTGVLSPRANTLYLACTSGALGKAVTWGYRPWERSLDDYEAAVRMVRADYCYDGTSWTVPGTPIAIRDPWNINKFASQLDPTEAVWGRDHLHCLAMPRNLLLKAPQVTCNGAPLPACPLNVGLATFPNTVYWVKNDIL